MRRFLIILVTVVLGAAAPVWAQDAAESAAVFDATTSFTENDYIAFIGEKIFFEKNDTYKKPKSGCVEQADGNILCSVVLHPRDQFRTRYRVVKTLSSQDLGDTVDFYSYIEGNEPYFGRYAQPLLFLSVDGKDPNSLSLEYSENTHRTNGGDWALCGTDLNYDHVRPEVREPLEPIDFSKPPIAAAVDKKHPEPIWATIDDGAVCRLGMYAQDLYDFRYNRWFLDDKREAVCKSEIGKFKGDITLKSMEAYKAHGQRIRACMMAMELKGLPANLP